MEVVIENPINNFLHHLSDSIEIAYFFSKDFDYTIKEVAPFFS